MTKTSKSKATANTWRNRIVGHDVVAADQFLANEANWRIHPLPQQNALSGSLNEIGWIQSVIVNKRTSAEWGERDRNVETLVDGHLRVSLAISKGEKVPVTYVDLTPDEERLALATIDPIAALAATDRDQLSALLNQISTDDEGLTALLDQLKETEASVDGGDPTYDPNYTRKIDIPIYEPSNEKPQPRALMDRSKADALIASINADQTLTDDERDFLTLAAYRHVVFDYARIADLYAHSSAAVQRLMEESALVIIDFNRAIELGYVKLTKEIAEMWVDTNEL